MAKLIDAAGAGASFTSPGWLTQLGRLWGGASDVPVADAKPDDIKDLLGGALFKALFKLVDCVVSTLKQACDFFIALDIIGNTTLVDFAQPVLKRFDQKLAALWIIQQIILQVRIALHDPDVAKHLIQHAG